ncbi:DUF3990 domain-containing protein [Adlercreutzia sp. R25]|uniref:DUF3990 domain-containing protein n=1 Tax=Adlercreutzia shanghongiae TaxID=3111773 RepID=A0ABU6IYS4_9ACTN|nr:MULTISPECIES: DUF3990 domain-containing protein [unclassified Adlercreutzia]MEC4271823.1 DUF3990 domain-containing protein [Adlercreutzia sp. R25]MEC4294830.1 DUF3990 domain-containing protein [Adlercreutzia sp. R22]
MLALRDDLILYHGSYTSIDEIDLEKCAPGRDFGQGFYLTSSYDQARNFVPLSIKKHQAENFSDNSGVGFISTYRMKLRPDLSIHVFAEANADWLHFVAANRRGDLFPELVDGYKDFDVIVGKIANDRTARTLQLYVSGAFGEPGTPEADNIAIALLLPNRLEDQYCFLTPRAVECLTLEGSEPYGI